MSKVIHMSLNADSIDAAIKEIRDYAKWIERKAGELRERLAYFIAKDASAVFNSAVAEDDLVEGVITGSVDVTVDTQGENITIVTANGTDAVFMEFGAGVYFNGDVGSSPNPWGADLKFVIGSYSSHKPDKEVWGYYGDDGQIHLTHGTPASMPLYNAVQSVANDYVRIAKEVFSE